ncbi:Chromatin structure remodeling complex protein sfh1 [Taxawa tesnikishii (nom. ined.)]|nr:Chromatin structure remodeling complex protein sfh1 [Dothideales sp. JES 119]
MSSASFNRNNPPQAFVSSYAPRIRTYANSLLTPALQPQTVIPPLRTTKRGTTAINYSEDFETDSLDDSDAPRRPTGLRSLRKDESNVAQGAPQKELGKELSEPVDVQGIWREWMGKPKKMMTEKQVHVQPALPLTLIPIRIDLDIKPFQPEPALPKPNNARELGLDLEAPAYKLPEMTPEYRLKDYFMWNLHEALMTPDYFAKVFVDELDFPQDRKPALVMAIAQQIRTQLEEHAGVALHPLFQENPKPSTTQPASVRPPLSRDPSGTPLRVGTPNQLQAVRTNGHASVPATPQPTEPKVTATAQQLPVPSLHNLDDAARCVISLSVNLQNQLYTDKFEWSLLHPPGTPEIFAKQTCADLGLSGEWVPAIAHAIYEAVLKLKKEVCENGGSLLGIVGSGVNAWGELENEAAEVHGDGSVAIGAGAGWRYDNEHLGDEWEPKVEVLSKEEIEKREGDRERVLRRLRRETQNRMALGLQPQSSGLGGSFYGEAGAEEERMGRGERAKKKRRFRSLSPVGRETPEVGQEYTGAGKLSEAERQYWHCSHCRVWGGAVWGVRDGPAGPRTLCANCGLLYDRDKILPPWNKDLYANERPHGTASTTHFVPSIARAQSQQLARMSRNSPHSTPQPLAGALPEQYAATARGGGPSMFDEYAVDGEDLDWTKVTDPRERKRLQNIINGRKYRERRLAQEAEAQGRTMTQSVTPGPPGEGWVQVLERGHLGWEAVTEQWIS